MAEGGDLNETEVNSDEDQVVNSVGEEKIARKNMIWNEDA